MKGKQIIIFSLSNLVLTLTLILGYNIFFNTSIPRIQELRESTHYEYINPLLECNIEYKYYNPKNLESHLEVYIQDTIENTGVTKISYYARLLNNGATFGYEENIKYTPASLIKVPLAIAFLKEKSFSSLQNLTTITRLPVDILQRNFGEDTISLGKQYSFSELFDAMLKKSDNTAALAVLDFLGEDALKKVYSEFGLEGINFSDLGSIQISPKSYASFFRILYNASYIPREDSEYLLSLMIHGDFKTGIAQLLPSGVKVANKFGERKNPLNNETQLHDCGIIYAKENPYVLCVMTQGGDFQTQLQSIQTLSKMIYDNITGL